MSGRGDHACRDCGHRSAKWLGRCPECGAWGSIEQREPAAAVATRAARVRAFPEVPQEDAARLSTGLTELDRVLGGGLVPGAVVLVGGEPGIGKSTLLLQAASALAESGLRVLYVSGEESASQLRARGQRLGARSANLLVSADTDADAIVEAAREVRPSAVIVDSIQAVRCTDLAAVPGSVAQVRECAARFVGHAKSEATPMLIVGHVTKDGAIAGPRVLEHVVDTIVQFEGVRHHEHRVLRTLKNRFGPSDELGIFRMTERGLEQVTNPSEELLARRADGVAGTVVFPAIQGTRPLLTEIQALVAEPGHGPSRRTAVGVDPSRLALILAVLQRRAGVDLVQRDVFVNVTGGLTLTEPAADLAVAAAVLSAAWSAPLPPGLIVAGEIGLTGEVRAVARLEARLREASRLGLRRALVPGPVPTAPPGLEPLAVSRVEDALRSLFGPGTRQIE